MPEIGNRSRSVKEEAMKTISRVVVLLAVLAGLAACGGGGGGGGGDSNSNPNPPRSGTTNWDQMVRDQDNWS